MHELDVVGDTIIQCEDGADEDLIRLDCGGTEALVICSPTYTYIDVRANDMFSNVNYGGSNSIYSISREFTMSGATELWGSILVDGVIVFGINARVTELITGCTSIDIGINGGDTDIFVDGMGVALDTVATPADANDISLLPYYHIAGGTPSIQITAVGGAASFSGGKLRVEVHWMRLFGPTS